MMDFIDSFRKVFLHSIHLYWGCVCYGLLRFIRGGMSSDRKTGAGRRKVMNEKCVWAHFLAHAVWAVKQCTEELLAIKIFTRSPTQHMYLSIAVSP